MENLRPAAAEVAGPGRTRTRLFFPGIAKDLVNVLRQRVVPLNKIQSGDMPQMVQTVCSDERRTRDVAQPVV